MQDDAGRTMTKADLVNQIFEKMGLTKKEATDVVEFVFAHLKDTLKVGEKVKISGFGSFVIRKKSARVGRNPKTGEEMTITARKVLTFKPSPVLRAMLNREFIQRANAGGAAAATKMGTNS